MLARMSFFQTPFMPKNQTIVLPIKDNMLRKKDFFFGLRAKGER